MGFKNYEFANCAHFFSNPVLSHWDPNLPCILFSNSSVGSCHTLPRNLTDQLEWPWQRRLRIFENRILSRIFGPKRDTDGEWRRLHKEELGGLAILSSHLFGLKHHLIASINSRIISKKKERLSKRRKATVCWVMRGLKCPPCAPGSRYGGGGS